jgi:hypothetical protein
LLLLGALIVASFFEPFQIVPGLLHGDAFFRLRPARYWREVLRKDGERGQVRGETRRVFLTGTSASVPVLRQCLHDPDRNVRWPAVLLVGRRVSDRLVVPILCEALDDNDAEVRLQAIDGLLLSERKSPQATQKLVNVMKNDPEAQLRHWAEKALWRIDPQAAREARGWLRYVSNEWKFSADVPSQPKLVETVFQTPAGPVPAHAFQFWMYPSCFGVIVNEYPKEFVESTPERQRNDELRKSMPVFFQGGKITSERQVEVQGHKGVETRIEVDNMGDVRQRHFWVGHRMYVVTLIFQREFVIPEAANYFLESFRFEAGS